MITMSKREFVGWMLVGLTVSIPAGVLIGVLLVDMAKNGNGWSWVW